MRTRFVRVKKEGDEVSCPSCGLKFRVVEGNFQPPTSDQVSQHALHLGYVMDGGPFVDYHSSAGWKVGKKPMVDWKRAVGTWIRNHLKWGDGQVQKRVTKSGVRVNIGFQGK
jgi:hypothetical protein